MLLDLTGCGFIDAAGLRVLLRASERVLRAGAGSPSRPPAAGVRRIFDLTGLDRRLAMFDEPRRRRSPRCEGRARD